MKIDSIVLDLDDVLNSCTLHILQALGCDVSPETPERYPEDAGYDIVGAWSKLTGRPRVPIPMFWEWVSRRIWEDMPESGQFWILDTCARLVGEENVLIATSPTKSADCHAAKYHWIRDHIPDWCKRQYSITPRKWRLSMPGVLLIDDSDSNCLKFKNRPDGKPSGDAMIMPRPWNYSWQIGKSNLKTNAAVAERLGKLWTTKQH